MQLILAMVLAALQFTRPDRPDRLPPLPRIDLATMEVWKAHVVRMIQPVPVPGRGGAYARITISKTGSVKNVEFVATVPDPKAPNPKELIQGMQSAISQASKEWSFEPFDEGEVTAIVSFVFYDGMVASPLWMELRDVPSKRITVIESAPLQKDKK